MAQERGYERQVGSAQPVGLPDASPASFGAGVGAAIAEAGQTVHQVELRAYQIERQVTADQESADAAAKIAEARLALEKRRAEARAAPAAGASGHADAMSAAFDAATKGIGDTITDDRVRRSVTSQIGEMRAGFVGSEVAWQTGMGAKKVATDLGNAADNLSALVASNPLASAEASMAWDDAVDAQQNIGEDVREAVRREGHAKLALAYGRRLMDDQPEALLTTIDKGAFNDVLDGAQIDGLRNGAVRGQELVAAKAAAAQRAAEHEAEERAADAKRIAREQADVVKVKIASGIVPTASEINAARGAAASAGLPADEQLKLDVIAVQTDVNRRYVGKDGDALRLARDTYRARGGENDQVAAAQLDDLVDRQDAADAAELATLKGKGPGGTVEALGMIRGSAERRHDVAEKLGAGLGYVAGLAPAAQRWTLEGEEILKARPKEFGDKERLQRGVDGLLGPLKSVLGPMYGDVLKHTNQIYAVVRNSKGENGYEAADLATAFKLASGGSTRRDGAVQGGIARVRGKPVILPDWQTAPEFDVIVSRASFAGAYFADNTPIRGGAQAMTQLRPEWVGDDEAGNPFYRFIDAAGRPARKANKDEFHLRLARRR